MIDQALREKLQALEASQQQIIETTRQIALSKQYGDLDEQVRKFFKENALIKHLEPKVWRWTDQAKIAKALKAALNKARVQLEAAASESTPRLATTTRTTPPSSIQHPSAYPPNHPLTQREKRPIRIQYVDDNPY